MRRRGEFVDVEVIFSECLDEDEKLLLQVYTVKRVV
jgi:hypothetical protein